MCLRNSKSAPCRNTYHQCCLRLYSQFFFPFSAFLSCLCEICPFCVSRFIGVVCARVFNIHSHMDELPWVYSFPYISRRGDLTADFLFLWLLKTFSIFSCDVWWSLDLRCRSFAVDGSVGMKLHNSAFCWVMVFCNGLCCKGKVFRQGMRKSYTYLWV